MKLKNKLIIALAIATVLFAIMVNVEHDTSKCLCHSNTQGRVSHIAM